MSIYQVFATFDPTPVAEEDCCPCGCHVFVAEIVDLQFHSYCFDCGAKSPVVVG